MAASVTARFNADFTAFQDAVRRGVKSVEELERAAGASETGVQRLQRAFSGDRIIREAADVAEAVNRIGNSSKLTEKEQARVNATVTEAIAKYKALGIEAPADIQKLAKETEGAAKSVQAMQSPLAALGASLTAALGPAAIAATVLNAAKKFLDFTGKLTDLSAKTGISTTALQKLSLATEESGISVEQVAGAVTKLGRNLVEGDKSAVKGIGALGLSVDDLLKMSPDQAFLTIGDAIGKIENPMERATLATKIFGKSGADMLPAFTGHLQELVQKAKDSGAILSDDMVAGGDAAGDAIGRLGRTLMGLAGSVLGPLMPALETIADLLGRVLGAAAKFIGDRLFLLGAQFLEIKMRVLDFAASMGELAQKAPWLADKLGITTDRIAGLRESADQARRQLQEMAQRGAQPAADTLAKAAPIIGEYSEKTTKASKAVEGLAKELSGQGAIEQVKKLEAAFLSLTPQQQANEKTVKETLERYTKLREEVGTGVSPVLEGLVQKTGTLKSSMDMLDGSTGKIKLSFLQLPGPIKHTTDELTELRANAQGLHADGTLYSVPLTAAANWARLAPAINDTKVSLQRANEEAERTKAMREGLDKLSQSLGTLAQVSGPLQGVVGWLAELTARTNTVSQAQDQFGKAMESIKAGGKEMVVGLVNAAASVAALSAAFIQAITTGNTFQRTLSGMQMGAQLGAQFGPVGAAIGALAGGLAGLISGLRGVSPAVQEARKNLTDFQASLQQSATATQLQEAAGRDWALTLISVRDAYRVLGRSAAEAEALVARVFATDNPQQAAAALEEARKAIEEARKATELWNGEFTTTLEQAAELGVVLPDSLRASIEQLIEMGQITGDQAALFQQLYGDGQTNFKAMEEAARKFGVELSALGPAFAQNRLNEQAKEIIDAYDAMIKGGGDVAGVIAGMSDEINKFVQDAIASGRTVPENMRPILEAMLAQGQLTDANGTKLEDLSGINFGPPIESAFDKIIAKLQELIDRISGGMGFGAAEDRARQFAANATQAIRAIPTDIPIRFEARGDDMNQDGDPGFAQGTKGRTGRWFGNFGRGTLAMLHGEEAVVRKDQAAAFAQAVDPSTPASSDALAMEIAGLRADFASLPQLLGRAVRDAILVAG